ncbi:hypothetical protein BDN70DRAFT_385383 [Pholiota conissans]|uniref:Rhodopsin domain-containing protein n=1 Tax=Pholiota conissans TaxID=109636 RepID=A0A9P5YQ54_9AGAR|nr:hypothetical protein BDN70DRAFT_385383 [Pholiota conissans]
MLKLAFGVNLGLDIFVTLLHVTVIGFTCLRVHYRKRTHRLWWDDFTAALAVLIDCGYVTILWFSYSSPGSILHSRPSHVARYWLLLELFFIVIWLSRISIALAIARVFPAGESTRKFAIGMAAIFAAFFAVIIIYFSLLCSKKDAISITSSGSAQCNWTNALRVIITSANLLSDAFLVAVPLYKLWRVRLPKRQRRLILGGFAASIMTTVPTVGCAIFQFAPSSWDPARQDIRLKLTYFESGNAIMASNLLVIITYFDTVRRRATEQSLVPQSAPETCQTRGSPPATHSNQVPPTAMLSTLYLTEISDADADYDRFSKETTEHRQRNSD